MDSYTLSDIISFLDNDSKIVCNRINNIFRNIIGVVKWYHDKKEYTKFDIIENCRDDAIDCGFVNMICGQYNSRRLYSHITKSNRLMKGYILNGACVGCQKELATRLFNEHLKTQDRFDCDFLSACEGGDKEIIDMFLTKTTVDINCGLFGACISGKRDVIDYLISKGANDWNRGMEGARFGGNLDAIEYMRSKGATN